MEYSPINQDTYEKWHSIINKNRIELKSFINRVSGDQNDIYNIVKNNLEYLTDMKFIYERSSVVEKQQLLFIEFDNNLYYQDGMYQTHTMLEFISDQTKKLGS